MKRHHLIQQGHSLPTAGIIWSSQSQLCALSLEVCKGTSFLNAPALCRLKTFTYWIL